MKTGPIIALIIIIAAIVFGVWYLYQTNLSTATNNIGSSSSTTSTSGNTGSSTQVVYDQSISDGTIGLSFSSADWGLATNAQQILVHSYIPPCDPAFNYCLYYIGSRFQGTNFESAGIRIQTRTDLTTTSRCLMAEPNGYTGLTPKITTSTKYSVSVFPQISDAAAGHLAFGTLYRLSYQSKCYEFETRIGQTQYANYPSGSIREFTPADQAAIQSAMQSILGTLRVASTSVTFPQT
jgi:hypothetical protein